MKNGEIKSNERDSPKTPGGISKSHLTSIRRLGLSRKWKKSGVSPFVSPLASNNVTKTADNIQEDTMTRKRKLHLDDDPQLSPVGDETNEIRDFTTTPPVGKEIPHTNDSTPVRKATRKRSRTLPYKDEDIAITVKNNIEENLSKITESIRNSKEKQPGEDISPKNLIQLEDTRENNGEIAKSNNLPIETEETKLNNICNTNENKTAVNPEMPNKLIKECIVVIQNKILKKTGNKTIKQPDTLCDSDNEDIPLSHFNKNIQEINNSDDEFKNKENNYSSKIQPIKKTKSRSSKKKQDKKSMKEDKEKIKSSQSSNSFSDDDDFELNRRVIFFPKHDKIIKPVKAKSTGSITQKDIDELKARIEIKKQLLFAKAQSKDTEEVRGLIKKWRKGCQDALMELLQLMKKKLPDNSDMNYSNILEMLKIPPSYVGYDEDNDCFSTPDDSSILTSIFSDL